jgi:oligopeptide/dipeptide ABC transporter ATP-binding protein
MTVVETSSPLLEVSNLVRYFESGAGWLRRGKGRVHAVDGVSFTIDAGETLGLVGESGCGKSTTGRLVLGTIEPDEGAIRFEGQPIRTQSSNAWRNARRDIQMIFQDPAGALNPRIQVGSQIREPLDIHGIGTRAEREARVGEMLRAVSLPPDMATRYPHELSGGQQQRVVIARALILDPKLIVCDEPVSALDVSVQAQVINLLQALQRRMGMAYLFISHALSVVRHISDRIAVMYLGQIVEIAPRNALFAAPRHPYTKALIAAIPVPDPRERRERLILTGDPPSALDPPSGCRFHTRCPYAEAQCVAKIPAFRPVASADGGTHMVACHLVEQGRL